MKKTLKKKHEHNFTYLKKKNLKYINRYTSYHLPLPKRYDVVHHKCWFDS